MRHRLPLAFSEYGPAPKPLFALPAEPYDEIAVRDRDIDFYSRRVAEDPSSALDRVALARLLFDRARSTGAVDDLDRAEALARQAIDERSHRNSQAFELLATVLMSKHEFQEARVIALQLDSLNPGLSGNLALLGEIELELGEYSSAASRFEAVSYDGRSFTTAARIARWYELTGRSDRARAIIARAIAQVDRRDDLPSAQAAWFHYRLGDLNLRAGRVKAADSAFRRGLALYRDDVRLNSGLARAALARGSFHEAITLGEMVLASQLDPEILVTIGRAHAALGDTSQVSAYVRAVAASALDEGEGMHRTMALFLLDYGSQELRASVLKFARSAFDDRRDVYGHDLLAWALHRNGDAEGARGHIKMALAHGTQDVGLAEHARAIGVTRLTP